MAFLPNTTPLMCSVPLTVPAAAPVLAWAGPASKTAVAPAAVTAASRVMMVRYICPPCRVPDRAARGQATAAMPIEAIEWCVPCREALVFDIQADYPVYR